MKIGISESCSLQELSFNINLSFEKYADNKFKKMPDVENTGFIES